jgi:hypothetical protein
LIHRKEGSHHRAVFAGAALGDMRVPDWMNHEDRATLFAGSFLSRIRVHSAAAFEILVRTWLES